MTVCRRAACVPPSRFVKVIDVTLVVRQEQEQRHPGSQTTLLPARAASPWFSFSSVTLEPWTLHAYTVGRSHWTDAVARSHFRQRPDTNLFCLFSEPGGMRPILWANLFHLCASYTSHLSLRFQSKISWNPNGSVFQCFSGRGSATTADFCQLQEYLRWHNINMMSETFF